MKHGNYILIITIILGILGFSCRSSGNSVRQSDRVVEVRTESETIRNDSTKTVTEHKDSVSTANNIFEYIRTTTYMDNGGVSSLHEEWRQTGSVKLSVSSGRTSEVSVTTEKTDSTSAISEQVSEFKEDKVLNDSRPVQGVEWIYITGGCAFGLGLIFLFYYLYRRYKK